MPVGTDLVLHAKGDRAAILMDGDRLGSVVREAAERYRTPLAFPLMDLTVEKAAIAAAFGVPESAVDQWHLDATPTEAQLSRVRESEATARMKANAAAIRNVREASDLVPVGMSIGPFSLMTKLIADPITPVFLAGEGTSADEDEEVARVEAALRLAETLIARSLHLQASVGARAVFVCEPAANLAYFSPNQLAAGADTFERYVLEPNRRLKARLDAAGIDLIFHDCGELTPEMVAHFGEMRPAVLSLGSSRCLWEDAARVPKEVVLYGNLPSKRFYSDELTTVESVRALVEDLAERMQASGHPFILGSECDVLAVPGAEATIQAKVQAMLG